MKEKEILLLKEENEQLRQKSNAMFQEKNHLNDKITKIKLSLTEIKKKYENELLRKDMKISQQKLN